MPTTLSPAAATIPAEPLRPELRVLLASASGGPLTLRHLAGVDWNELGRSAARHGLVPQLYRALGAMAPEAVPAHLRRMLEEEQRSIVQRGLRLTAALLEIHEALTAAGIRALPYKGPTLSRQLYNDPALRDAVDLDILLPNHQLMAALEVMARLGFVPAREYRPEIRGQLRRYRAEFGLLRDDLLVELQWRLAPAYFAVELDFEQLWQRRGSISLGDRTLPVLSAEDNLVVLCVHGAKHHWSTLKWLADVDRLLQATPAVDLKATLVRAEALGVRRIVETALMLTAELFETPLPEGMRNQLSDDPRTSPIAAEVRAAMAADPERGEAEHHRFQLALRERRRDRWLYAWRLAWQPTESEWDAIHLPPGLAWLYPAVRLGRVAAKALRLG